MGEGHDLRDEGAYRVSQNASQEWVAKADLAIAQMAALGGEFTAEHVRVIVGNPVGHPNVMGARFLHAAKAGIIKRVGYTRNSRASAHARVVSVWRGV